MAKYEAMGGVHVVTRQCEEVFASLSVEDQTRCLHALTRLIFVPDSGPATPQSASEASILPADRVALEAFLSAGILVREREDSSQTNSLRFADRIFLDGLQRVQRVEEDREFLRWRQRLDKSLSAWQSSRRAFTLLNVEQLAEARRQAAQHPGELNEQELAYIEESSSSQQADVQRLSAAQTRQKLSSYAWATAGAFAILALGTYFFTSQQHAAQFQSILRAAQQASSAGDFQEALAQYRKATAIRPDDPVVAKETGSVYASLGRPKEAVQAFDKVVSLAPMDIDALAQRADVYAQLGSIQAAQSDWLRVLTVVPGDPHTKLDLAQIMAKKPEQTTVIFYDRGIADPTRREQLIGKLQDAGFLVQRRPYGLTQPTNILWYASGVPEEQWRKAAQLLLQASVVLREVKQADIGPLNIQIGYSAEASHHSPLTPEDLGTATGSLGGAAKLPH